MNTTLILRSITTSTSRHEERADGVIVQRVLVTRIQTLADARENSEAFAKLAAGRPRPAVIDIRIIRAIQTEARDHYASPESTRYFSAIALLVASPSSHQISQHYISQKLFSVPVRQFVDPAEAFEWLRQVTADQASLGDSAAV
jgi:hypothetical protein